MIEIDATMRCLGRCDSIKIMDTGTSSMETIKARLEACAEECGWIKQSDGEWECSRCNCVERD